MEYTEENIDKVAQKIVDEHMDLDDLINYVYDDLCAIMNKDEELFHINVENFGYESISDWTTQRASQVRANKEGTR